MDRSSGIGLMLMLIAGFFACATPPRSGSAREATVAFTNVTVLPMMTPDVVVSGQTVLVNANTIVAVEPSEEVNIPEGVTRIDGSGQFLIPGLADMHVHLELSDDPGVLDLFLANGVTTVRSMDGRPYILAWRDEIAAGTRRGPAIVTAGPLLDGDPPIWEDATVVATPEAARAAVNGQAERGYDFIKVTRTSRPRSTRPSLGRRGKSSFPWPATCRGSSRSTMRSARAKPRSNI